VPPSQPPTPPLEAAADGSVDVPAGVLQKGTSAEEITLEGTLEDTVTEEELASVSHPSTSSPGPGLSGQSSPVNLAGLERHLEALHGHPLYQQVSPRALGSR
jgi:hypothetical protein